MQAAVYRNVGAKWSRPDGSVVAHGAEFVPTPYELSARFYKLRFVRTCEADDCPDIAAAPVNGRTLEDYALGGGWYLIGGVKVQGREAATVALGAL